MVGSQRGPISDVLRSAHQRERHERVPFPPIPCPPPLSYQDLRRIAYASQARMRTSQTRSASRSSLRSRIKDSDHRSSSLYTFHALVLMLRLQGQACTTPGRRQRVRVGDVPTSTTSIGVLEIERSVLSVGGCGQLLRNRTSTGGGETPHSAITGGAVGQLGIQEVRVRQSDSAEVRAEADGSWDHPKSFAELAHLSPASHKRASP